MIHGTPEVIGSTKDGLAPRPVVARQVDPPSALMATGKVAYRDVFVALLFQMDLMPIGLYKAPNPELGNSVPFEFTNPAPDDIVHPGDRVFVLAPA